MRIRSSHKTNQGLTLIEAIVVLAGLAILFVVLAPTLLPHHYNRAPRISCMNNLKQTDLAAKIWAGDNNDQFPMNLSISNGGTLELLNTPDAWKTYQVMSNELSTPKVLFCPADSAHGRYATNFTDDLKTKLSYFIGADATTNGPSNLAIFLSGDDDFLFNQSPIHTGLVNVTSPVQLDWDGDRHGNPPKKAWFEKPIKNGVGNIGLVDGSVQGVTPKGLENLLAQTGLATNRLVIP